MKAMNIPTVKVNAHTPKLMSDLIKAIVKVNVPKNSNKHLYTTHIFFSSQRYKPTMETKACQVYENIKLKRHQKLISDFLLKKGNRGIIAFYGTGTGKSITALTAARCLRIPAIFILPGAVLGGFEREIGRLKELNKLDIELFSYGKFLNQYRSHGNKFVKDKLLIVDEVHNFRSIGNETLLLIEACQAATKVLLLTGTPLQNEPKDIISLLCMIDPEPRKIPVKEYVRKKYVEFVIALENYEMKNKVSDLADLLWHKVSYFNVDLETHPKYPSVTEKYIKIPMTKSYQHEYEVIETNKKSELPSDLKNINLAVFYNGLRRATNKVKVESPKLKEIMRVIFHHLKLSQKIVVYSTWQDSGIKLIKDNLHEHGIKTSIVSGEETQASKSKAVINFNNETNPVILITKAGAAGLDLKRARVVIVMEPHWNDELIKQVIGRAARYESHIDLPASQQNVTVYRFILTREKEPSVDQIIDSMAKEKDIRNINFYKILRRCRYKKSDV